ncbi:MAG: HD domain-containing protein [Caldilineaceae bacterium]
MTDWRSKAQALARRRAEREAMQKWRVDDAAQIPFSYRWEHVQAVVGLAIHLAEQLDADCEVMEAAAWLHDICKMEPQHALVGAAEASVVLADTDFPPHKIAAVVDAIRQHEGMTRPEDAPPLTPIEAAILWDADKLSKLGVQTIVYSMSAPYGNGKSLPQRRADFKRFAERTLSRTVDSMNTPPAREIAQRRYAEMMQALAMWAVEESEQTIAEDPS